MPSKCRPGQLLEWQLPDHRFITILVSSSSTADTIFVPTTNNALDVKILYFDFLFFDWDIVKILDQVGRASHPFLRL